MKVLFKFVVYHKRIVSFLVLFVWSLILFAQNLRQITTQDGLAGSAVTCVYQSDDGLIWVGTLDGINLYYGGKAVRPKSIHPYEGEIIERIVETSSYDMWVQTTHGLHKINRVSNEIHSYTQFTGLYILRPVSHDHVAVVDANSRLHLYHPATQSFEELTYPLSEGEVIMDMGGTDDFFWIASNKGIYRCSWTHTGSDKVALESTVKLVDTPVKYCSPTDNPEIIHVIDHTNRLYQLDIRQNTNTFLLQMESEVNFRGQPSGIVKTNDGYLISFKVNGVIKYTFDTVAHAWVKNDLGIKSGVFQMIKDKYQDLIWIATDGQGLFTAWEDSYTFQSYQFSDFSQELGKPVRTLFVDEEEWLWIGLKGEGLLGIDRSDTQKEIYQCTQRHFTSSNSVLKDNSVYALSESKQGGFWVGTDTGLNFFRYSDRSLQRVSGDEDMSYIHAIHETADSKLWIATVGAGVFEARIIKNGSTIHLEKIRHYEVENGNLSSNYFFAMHRTTNDEMWLGNRGKGLFKIQDTELKALETPSRHYSNLLNDIFALQEYNGVLWAGTGGGLLGLGPNNQEYVINTDNGLPNNIVHSMQVDDKGNLWAATNNGLARLDSTFTKVESYGRNKGLLVTEFSDGAVHRTPNKLYFGGVNGWVEISSNSNYKPQEKFVAPLYLMSLIDNKSQSNLLSSVIRDPSKNKQILKLKPGENSFSVSFTAVDHVTPNDYRYLYKVDSKMEGQWVDNGLLNTLSLSQMLPGNYTLHLKYRNLTTGVESEPIHMEIIIVPHWWQTTGMKLLYWQLFAAGIAYFVIRKYRRMKRKHYYALKNLEQQHKEELYEEKLRFFTNITHEFSTPLTLIYNPCERILAHEETDEYVRKYVQLIQKHTNRLYELIQEVIDYRRIETKHQQLHLERYNMSNFMLESCEVFIDWAEKNEISFKQEIEPDVYWNMDMRCIPYVVANLISNAIKYTPQGGTLKVKFSKLSEEQIEIRVYNTGKGIKEEDRQRIFNRYSVLDNVEERAATGIARNGLGMAICHSSVKLLGGNIEIISEVGKYAEFVVTLPLLPITEKDAKPVVKDVIPLALQNVEVIKKQLVQQTEEEFLKEETQTSKRFERGTKDDRPTILVVDDNKDVLFLLNESLSQSYQVKTARSADEALEQLRVSTPQLIITDVMMPEKDGMELTQQIKQNKHTMHIPLIILSAKITEDDKTKGVQMGADAYIGKPFNMQYLLAVIERLIESRKDMQQYYNSSACAYDYVEGQLLKREDKDFLHKLDEFVEAHLSDSTLTTEAIADAMNLSVRSLYRRLKELNLPSPKDYLKERKMEKVVKLLKTSDLSIQEIIFECGFNNRAHFYKDFSLRFGMTPKEYRKDQKNPEDTLGEK